jgi:hypothetical protein
MITSWVYHPPAKTPLTEALSRDTLGIAVPGPNLNEGELNSAEAVALRLKAEFSQLIETFPPAARKASAMARHLQLQIPLCHRVLTAARKPADAVETLTTIPGTQGLEMFIDAARLAGAPRERLEGTLAAVAEFHNLIQRFGGSQRKLAESLAVLAGGRGGVFAARRQTEVRESLFKRSAELYGSASDATVSVRVYVPSSETAGQLDVHGLIGRTRFERVNSSLPIVMYQGSTIQKGDTPQPRRGDQRLLDAFCSKPLPRITTDLRDGVLVDIVDPQFEFQDPVDLFAGPFSARSVLMSIDGRQFLNSAMVAGAPSRALVSDVYLPASVAANLTCSAAVFRPGTLGSISGDPSSRWFDRVPATLAPMLLGRGIGNAATDHYSRQSELTARVFTHLGMDPDQFVGYRLEVPFPLVQLNYVLSFESTVGPAADL